MVTYSVAELGFIHHISCLLLFSSVDIVEIRIFSLLSPCSLLETTSFGLFFCLFEIKHGDECVCNVFRSTCYSLIVLHMVTPCSEPMHVSTEEMIITSAFFCKENEDEEDCIIVSCL